MLAGPEGAAWGTECPTHTHTAFAAKADMGNGAAQMSAYDQSGRFETEKCGSSEDRFLTPKYATIFKYERFIW
jgi:hypothetical protein